MPPRIRVLLVEDSPDDAELVTRALERGGYPAEVTRVEDGDGMSAALAAGPWDLVIADHSLPRFSSTAAIATLRAVDEDIGCVIVSGSLGEEAAVQAMRAGADDYVLKDRLGGLGPAVERTFRTAQARRDRRRAEGRYRMLVENAPDGVVTTDRAGIMTSLNPAFETMCGVPIADAVGRHFSEFVHPEDAAAMAAGFAGALAAETPMRTQIRVLNRGGLYFHAELTIARLVEGGRVVGLFSLFRDVSERRTMERELRRSEGNLRTLVNSAPDGIFTLTLRGELSGINPALQALLGEDHIRVGRHFRDFIHPDDLARASDSFARRLRGEIIPPYELRLLRGSGEVVDVEVTSAALTEGGKVTGTLGIVRDISVRREAEQVQARLQQAIQAAANDWTATFDAVPMMVLLLDGECRIQRLNRAAREAMASPWKELLQRALTDVPGVLWGASAAAARHALIHGTPRVDQVDNGREGRTWNVVAAPMHTSTGGEVVLVIRDTTELVELQRHLARERTMSALGALVAGVAHEVRNPLFAISATLDAFEARFGKEPEYARYTGNLRPEVARLSTLMRDLLEYGRPAELRLIQSDLVPVARETVTRSESAAATRGIRLEVKAPDGALVARHDPARLQQVIQNLVDNALVHAPPASRISVTLAREARGTLPWARISVEDEGPGFKAEDLPHLFEPFFSKRRGGTGLGLSIVERLVEQHGGQVVAENRAEGGARVTVQLPLA
jgi:PAS domain S-box-containing protein